MQEALAYFLRSFGNAVGDSLQLTRLTCHFEPPLLSNMGFSISGENWFYKQSKKENTSWIQDYTNPVHMHK